MRGLEVVARMTHVDEWDEAAMLEAAVALKMAEAELTTALVESCLAAREGRLPSPAQQAPGIALQLLDRALAGLHLELLGLHVQVQDPRSSSCMGLRVGRLSVAPVAKAARPDGGADAAMTPAAPCDDVAVPRQVEIEEARLYVNPTVTVGKERRPDEPEDRGGAVATDADADAAAPPPLYIGHIDLLAARVGLPEVGAVLCAAGRRPNGQGRRLTVSGDIHGLRLELRAPQMHHFVFHLLHVFYGGEFAAWRNAVIAKHREGCRPVTPLERERYLQLDRALRAAAAAEQSGKSGQRPPGGDGQHAERSSSSSSSSSSPEEVQRLVQEREALEGRMSYADIVRLRGQARGWGPRLLQLLAQQDGGGDDRWLEPELLLPHSRGAAPGEEEGRHAEECRALALVVGRARAQHWNDNQRIREFWLERLNIGNLEVGRRASLVSLPIMAASLFLIPSTPTSNKHACTRSPSSAPRKKATAT